MSECVFLRVVTSEDKAEALRVAVESIKLQTAGVLAFLLQPCSFREVPGSPFAYWVPEQVRSLFADLPTFEGEGRTAKQGLATADDFRFVRTWWEVAAERTVSGTPGTTPEEFRAQTMAGKRWVPFAKGGAYSPYYSDLHLVVNWECDGRDIRGYVEPSTGRTLSRPQSIDHYFRAGLTWSLRTTSGLSFRPFGSGAIFGHKGPALFAPDCLSYLGLLQSSVFESLVALQLAATDAAARSYEVGVIQRTPVPRKVSLRLRELARSCFAIKQSLDVGNELSHVFLAPAVLFAKGGTLSDRSHEWQKHVCQAELSLEQLQDEINDLALDNYDLGESDTGMIPEAGGPVDMQTGDDSEEDSEGNGCPQGPELVEDVMSYVLGAVLGRWDVRLATGEWPLPEPPDPFAPLPVCSPGMLTGSSGLPARQEVPSGYPISIQWDGILPDDEGHPNDLVARVREVLAVLFPGQVAAIEDEACRLLGARDMRSWFRDQFFGLHLKRYSKSRRKAPIYWQLRSARKSYSLWLYYPRITADTLWTAIRAYVEPKLEYEGRVLDELKGKLGRASAGGEIKEERALAQRVEEQERLLQELLQFKGDLLAVANRGYEPDLDDGVLLNIAPLYRAVCWKDAEAAWRELETGNYHWSTMAERLRGTRA